MKRIFPLVFAAILGSAITLGVFLSFFQTAPATTTTPPSNASATNSTVSTSANLTNTNHSNNYNTLFNKSSSSIPGDFTTAAAKSMPAVVHIKSTQKQQTAYKGRGGNDSFDIFRDFFGEDFFFGSPYGGPRENAATGSGVIISDDGFIVTNNHVIADAHEVEVTLFDKRKYAATLIGTDPSTDIALLKIDDSRLPSLTLANSDNARVGEWVLAVGNPFNLSSTVTAGIVSAKGRNLDILKDRSAIESFIQTDAAVNPGNSGGALVNLTGDLLGINTAIATPTGTYAGYSFAVPANIVSKVIEDLKTHGTVQRGYLGVSIENVDGNFAKENNLSVNQGVFISDVTSGGSAAESGLRSGDVIVKIDDRTVKSAPDLQEMVARHRPGDTFTVTVNRNGVEKDIEVLLKNKYGNTKVTTLKSNKTIESNLLGAKLKKLSNQDLQNLGLESGIQIISLNKGGQLARSTDIQEGFVITKINDKNVEGVEQFNQMLNELNQQGKGVLLSGVYPGYKSTYYYGFGL